MTPREQLSRDWLRRLIATSDAPKSDAAAGMEDRTSPSDPFLATAAASGAEHPILKTREGTLMQFAEIPLAIGIADALDDDIAGFDDVAVCLLIVAVLLIGFAWLDDFIIKRWSPVSRIVWLRRFSLRAWR